MATTPINLSRAPNLLMMQSALANINRTNLALFKVSQQLSTGLAVATPSDDPVKAAAIGVVDDRIDRSNQLKRNLAHASSALETADSALQEATDLATEARSIALTQGAITSSPVERQQQAVILDQIIQSMLNTASRKGPAGYVFGGSITSRQPVQAFGTGYRFTGEGSGLVTDLEANLAIPITLGGGNPIAARSARVRGSVDLDPQLTNDTRLAEVRGARGLGVTLGSVEYSINGGPRQTLDLSGADSMGDVVTKLTNSLRQYETDNTTTVLGAGGVSVSGEAIAIDAAPSTTIQFFDQQNGVTAQDLGLADDPVFQFSSSLPAGAALDPELTWRSPISALAGVTGALGAIKINNVGRTATIDLSTARTLEDIKNSIESANLGVRVAINADGTGIDVLNDVSAARGQGMSIEEVTGNDSTATRLGIRSMTEATAIADFNDGRGVQIIDGAVNPVTGLPDASLDADFQITLGDPAPTVISVNLRAQDMLNVQTLLARINSEAGTQLAAAGLPATAFEARLSDGGNGLYLAQDSTFTGNIGVTARNNSPAAEQLGLLGGTYDAGLHTFVGADPATVRVESVFTHLIDLRDALRANDVSGITVAGEGLERVLSNLAETRGLVGGYAQRVDSATTREEDRSVLDQRVRSELADVDFAEASTRFSLLQTQLQAALRVTGASQQQSLLDFLG